MTKRQRRAIGREATVRALDLDVAQDARGSLAGGFCSEGIQCLMK
jgi:hypothetical protein